jgi:glycosyltransferase involved in cell wall biosynthesis
MEDSQRKQKAVLFMSLYTEMGGAEYCLYHQIKNLDRARYLPILLVNREGQLTEKLRAQSVEIVVLPFPVVMLKSLIRPAVLGQVFAAARSIKRYIVNAEIDLIQCSDVLSLILLLPAIFAKPKRVVYSVVFFYELSRAVLFNLLAFLFVDRIVTDSCAVREDLARKTVGLASKMEVIYHCVDSEEFRPSAPVKKAETRKKLSIAPDKKLIGFIGRYEFWKGHRTFIEAAKLLLAQRGDLQFLMVGGAMTAEVVPHIASYRREIIAMSAPLVENRSLLVFDHRDDIAEIMPALDLFVCPSDAEAFGLVVLEAYACGIPVVASKTVGALEILGNAGGVYRAEPGDARSFAETILAALQSSDGSTDSETAREKILQEYNWQEYARRFEKVYDGMI